MLFRSNNYSNRASNWCCIMPEVLVSNDDITVLGPPPIVELLVDIGPQGTRGSQFFVGVGDPNTVDIGQTPNLNDVYINTSPGGSLGYLYQYQASPGGNSWAEVLDIYPSVYSTNYDVTFDVGSAEVIIPVADIVTARKATAAFKDDGPYIMILQICDDDNYFHTYFMKS